MEPKKPIVAILWLDCGGQGVAWPGGGPNEINYGACSKSRPLGLPVFRCQVEEEEQGKDTEKE